jgi:transcriptional regulator with XRE-family HTH domain
LSVLPSTMVSDKLVSGTAQLIESPGSSFGTRHLSADITNGAEQLQKEYEPHTGDERLNLSFGQTMKALRESRRMSQGQLGRATGYDHSYISRIEAGNRRPSREVVSHLADTLGLVDNERNAFFAAGGFLPEDVPFAHMPAAFWDAALIMNDPQIDQPLKHLLTSTVASAVATINAYQEATNGRTFDIE